MCLIFIFKIIKKFFIILFVSIFAIVWTEPFWVKFWKYFRHKNNRIKKWKLLKKSYEDYRILYQERLEQDIEKILALDESFRKRRDGNFEFTMKRFHIEVKYFDKVIPGAKILYDTFLNHKTWYYDGDFSDQFYKFLEENNLELNDENFEKFFAKIQKGLLVEILNFPRMLEISPHEAFESFKVCEPSGFNFHFCDTFLFDKKYKTFMTSHVDEGGMQNILLDIMEIENTILILSKSLYAPFHISVWERTIAGDVVYYSAIAEVEWKGDRWYDGIDFPNNKEIIEYKDGKSVEVSHDEYKFVRKGL